MHPSTTEWQHCPHFYARWRNKSSIFNVSFIRWFLGVMVLSPQHLLFSCHNVQFHFHWNIVCVSVSFRIQLENILLIKSKNVNGWRANRKWFFIVWKNNWNMSSCAILCFLFVFIFLLAIISIANPTRLLYASVFIWLVVFSSLPEHPYRLRQHKWVNMANHRWKGTLWTISFYACHPVKTWDNWFA